LFSTPLIFHNFFPLEVGNRFRDFDRGSGIREDPRFSKIEDFWDLTKSGISWCKNGAFPTGAWARWQMAHGKDQGGAFAPIIEEAVKWKARSWGWVTAVMPGKDENRASSKGRPALIIDTPR
jgi:hypothetical protein